MNIISRNNFLYKSALLAEGAYPAQMALSLMLGAPAHAFALQGEIIGIHVVILGGALTTYTVLQKSEYAGGVQKVYNIEADGGFTFKMNDVMVMQK